MTVAQPLRAPGQPDDLVGAAEVGDQRGALGQQRVVGRGVEEAVPGVVPLEMVQAVPDVGDDPVDVEDRQHRTSVARRRAAHRRG